MQGHMPVEALRGRGLAIAGLVLGYIGLGWFVVYVLYTKPDALWSSFFKLLLFVPLVWGLKASKIGK